MLRILCVLLFALLPLQSFCAAIEEVSFDDAQQMQRYKALIAELRCPMCLNANLAGSDAPIAADLRAEIHKQILAGKSDKEILDFLVTRYGEFILYDPRLHIATSLLWFTPPLLLLLGFFVLRRMLVSSKQSAEPAQLSEQEQAQLQRLLHQDHQGSAND